MFELKPLTPAGVDAALKKAERYRLLNEPWEAESICRDVLAVDPRNRQARITLLLALTDQFTGGRGDTAAARALAQEFEDEYGRLYYAGIVAERRGKALLAQGAPGTGPVVYDWLRQAMDLYERAEPLRPPGDDDPILRWNTCARIITTHEYVRPAPETTEVAPQLE